jgi:hypothetical protein
MRSCCRPTAAAVIVGILAAASANAQTQTPAWGRFALFLQGSRNTQDTGLSTNISDFIGNLTIRSASNDDGGTEYAIDARGANYSGSYQQRQVSIYDAYVGYRTAGGTFGLRLGQMWLNDLGALGSVAGVLAEFRPGKTTPAGRLRLGLFGGAEPDALQAGIVSGVHKAGGYVALDGDLGRRHVLGFVTIRNQGLTEREVVTLLNFIPVGRKFFMYQAAEYDVKGPGGTEKKGLNYIFVNARWAPSDVIDFQGTYHHGLSIDARTITNDELNGRPVDPRLLTGFLFESAGGRLTVTVLRGLRVWAGYYSDRNNVDSTATGRINAGLWAGNILSSGIDVMVSDNVMDRTGNHYDSVYASLGASLGRAVYLSADYTTSLSILSFTNSGGVTIESRPQTKRYALSSNININRTLSLVLTAERFMVDTGHEDRAMAGFVIRF